MKLPDKINEIARQFANDEKKNIACSFDYLKLSIDDGSLTVIVDSINNQLNTNIKSVLVDIQRKVVFFGHDYSFKGKTTIEILYQNKADLNGVVEIEIDPSSIEIDLTKVKSVNDSFKLDDLKQRLANAVENEHYLTASIIRDEIENIKK